MISSLKLSVMAKYLKEKKFPVSGMFALRYLVPCRITLEKFGNNYDKALFTLVEVDFRHLQTGNAIQVGLNYKNF